MRLPLAGIDVFNTLMAPPVNFSWSLVLHFKTMHAYTAPEVAPSLARIYRQMQYPRSARAADAIIINSESLRSEVQRYLEVDSAKLKLVYEAVDHELFRPGDAAAARAHVAKYGVTKPFVLFVSSLWPYKNCDGLLRAWALARGALGDRQLVIVGAGRDEKYQASLHSLAAELGIASDVNFVGRDPARRDRQLLPGSGHLRLSVTQRDLRAAHSRSHGLRLPGRDLGHQRHAGDGRRSCGVVRP